MGERASNSLRRRLSLQASKGKKTQQEHGREGGGEREGAKTEAETEREGSRATDGRRVSAARVE